MYRRQSNLMLPNKIQKGTNMMWQSEVQSGEAELVQFMEGNGI